jgi:hypothetical protein
MGVVMQLIYAAKSPIFSIPHFCCKIRDFCTGRSADLDETHLRLWCLAFVVLWGENISYSHRVPLVDGRRDEAIME